MAKIIGNTTATPNPRPDWLQNDENKADYIKNKPEVVVRTDIDNELNLESGNPVQNSTITQRFNELDESLKEYIDEQNSEQDENLGKLETLVTETMKATEINENSTDEQYPTAKATYDFVKTETAALVESAPETLDTLNELAAALGDDPNFATTVAGQIGEKASKEELNTAVSTINSKIDALTSEKNTDVETINTELNTINTNIDGINSSITEINNSLDDKASKDHTHEVATTEVDGYMSTSDKKKLDNIEEGANKTIIDSGLSDTSTNPVENKVVNNALSNINSQIETLETQTNEKTNAIDSSIEEINSKLTTTSENITTINNNITTLGGKVNTNTEEIDNINTRIDNIENTGVSIALDSEMSETSTNPVQNKVIKAYTDTKIADLINSAPTTLDTLGEIATAMEENASVVEALNTAIGTKANTSDLTSHTSNKSNPHGVTLSQLGVTATATELNYVDGVTSNIQTQLNGKSATSHTHSNYASTSHTHDSLNAIDLSNKTVSLNNYNLSSGSPKVVYYVCPTDGGGANITGRPNDSTKQAFNLKVESLRFGSTTDYITKQTYTMGAQKIIYVRYCTNGSWTAWEKVYTSTQKPTVSEIGAAASSHTHNYAGSSSAGGAATSANRLYAPSIATTAGTTYTIDTYLTLIKNTLPLETQGYYTWKHSWSYAGNGLLSATIGSTTHKIQLAGAHCEFNGSSSGEYILRITTATASGTSGASFTAGATYQYNYHGATYSPIWTIDNAIVGLSVNGKTITYTKNNGTTGTITTQDTNTTYGAATQSANGLLSSTDKKKLDGIATGAEVNQNAFSNVVVGSTTIAADAKTDTLTVVAGSNITLTPDATNDKLTIAATNTTYGAATQSANGLMSAADKKKLDGIATGANAYTHPTTPGNKHIPSGGSAGQILRWSADGTAAWGADNNTTYTLGSFGISATATELNYCDGVTSNIQTQLNNLASDIGLNAMNIDNMYENIESLYTAYTGALNNLTAPGFYYVSNTDATNYPVGTNGHVLVMANTGSTVHIRQVFWRAGTINSNSYQWYTRNKTADGWSAWWLLSGIETRYTGTLTSGTANVGSIYGGASGWVIVAQVGANKRRSTLFIPRTFLNTDANKWCFTMSGDDYYFTFYFYYSGTTLYLKTNTSNPTTNAITHVYAIS